MSLGESFVHHQVFYLSSKRKVKRNAWVFFLPTFLPVQQPPIISCAISLLYARPSTDVAKALLD